ncbi:MAG: hypothetical protein ACKOF9_04435 [Burkholderiales bacterium]
MKSAVLAAILICVAVFSQESKSEILGRISYWDSFGNVKKLYPNASFTNLKPAWLQDGERLIQIDGQGIGAIYVILFRDMSHWAKGRLLRPLEEGGGLSEEVLQRTALLPDEQALVVQSVRMVHPNPVPIERYKSKYGPPSCSVDSDMMPICKWPSRALVASMSDDGKFVFFSTTNFTEAERLSGFRKSE